jgi:two-component system phosphate regulon sensor histidine kinase PhoR
LTLGIRAKLFLISLGLVVLSILVAYFTARTNIESQAKRQVFDDLAVRAELVAHAASQPSEVILAAGGWDALADRLGKESRTRVTLVALDGEVLGDSTVKSEDLPAIDDHLHRPEIQAAIKANEPRTSQRYSATRGKVMLYVAVPFYRDGEPAGVARVALGLTQLDSILGALRRGLFVSALLAIFVALFATFFGAQLGSRTARALTETAQRMAEGDLEVRSRALGNDEFAALGRALDQMAKKMAKTLGELREERDRLSGILESMDEGVLFLDEEGRLVLLNSTLRQMLMLPSEVNGRLVKSVIQHRELIEILQLDEDSAPVQREVELTGLKPLKLLVRVARLRDDQRGVLAVFVDVTETRRLENMRREFVANVSHELRTPVTSIRSAGESLKIAMETQPEMAVRFVTIVERNAERLQVLVEDLLNLSRMESREYSIDLEPIEPEPFIRQVLSLFSERAARLETRLEVEAEEAPLVRADSRALDHVLTNLVDNAVKYAGRSARVTVSAKNWGESVIFRVSDTGPGISAAHRARIFERFYRVDAGRSRDLGGTGLGLSIVKHLVDSMGGSVSVESGEGAGTTFIVVLPKWSEADEVDSTPADAENRDR